MANINDFKLLNRKCLTYYSFLEKEISKEINISNEKQKERLGFYLFMLETICNIKDISDIISLITDQEFNQIVHGLNQEDYGVDAIFIDRESYNINLFNFKFREKFNTNKQQSINEVIISTKFTNALIPEKTSHLNGPIKKIADEIIEYLNSNDVWKLKLYIISNDSVELSNNDNQVTQLKELYDLELISVGLDTIINEMSIRPKPIDAILHLNKDSIMPFSENSLSSSKSYIIIILAPELIRITCNNDELRQKYNIENIVPLSEVNMEYSLLFDNVRGLVLRSKFNRNIYETLKEEPSKFFMYNNGLTIIANDIVSEDTNANKKVKLTLKDFQVVNG